MAGCVVGSSGDDSSSIIKDVSSKVLDNMLLKENLLRQKSRLLWLKEGGG